MDGLGRDAIAGDGSQRRGIRGCLCGRSVQFGRWPETDLRAWAADAGATLRGPDAGGVR